MACTAERDRLAEKQERERADAAQPPEDPKKATEENAPMELDHEARAEEMHEYFNANKDKPPEEFKKELARKTSA